MKNTRRIAAEHCDRGIAAASRGALDEAQACYRQALELDPDNAEAHCNLGLLLAGMKQHAEAERCYRQAIMLAPQRPEPHANLGLLLDTLARDEEAEQCHRIALSLNAASAEIHTNLANLLARQHRDAEAERHYRAAIALAPASARCQSNLGTLQANTGREAEAEASFRRAIELEPEAPQPRLNLGYLLLAQGRFDEGWACHEYRYHPALGARRIQPPSLAFPQWRGEPLAGKSLLIWPEQGLGDEIQFCRYAPVLKGLGAARITLGCKPGLKTLMRSLDGVDDVLSAEDLPVSPHDFWTFPLSLPHLLGTRIDNIPARLPYLAAPPERAMRFEALLSERGAPQDGGMRIGLVWRGNPLNPNDANRSLPELATLAPLWRVPGTRFISLQTGPAAQMVDPPGQPLIRLDEHIGDFADTAAIVERLDLVFSVDTAVAHLTGALDKACWVLLPAWRNDWRWLEHREDSPWYPGCVRLFRQSQRSEWTPLIEGVKEALAERAR